MVTIINFKKSENTEGKEFISIKVQGGVMAIQSQKTGRMYLTAQTAYVSSTFDEATAKALIGSTIPGMVKRVASDPYEYTIKETGEVVTLSHKFEYLPEEAATQKLPAMELEEDFAPEESVSMR